MGSEQINPGEFTRDLADIQEIVTDNIKVLNTLNELQRKKTEPFNLSYFKRNSELKQTIISVRHLKRIVDMLDNAGYSSVLIETGEDTPILFSASDGSSSTLGLTAPRIDPDTKKRHLEPQTKFGKHEARCTNQQCNWIDLYESKEQALKAGREHRYFEGHQFKIYSPIGIPIHNSQNQGENQ